MFHWTERQQFLTVYVSEIAHHNVSQRTRESTIALKITVTRLSPLKQVNDTATAKLMALSEINVISIDMQTNDVSKPLTTRAGERMGCCRLQRVDRYFYQASIAA